MNGMPSVEGLLGSTLAGNAVSFGGALLIKGVFGKTWGIVNEYGIPILLADSVLGLTYDSGASISNYAVEKGTFASYNKVKNPSMHTVQMAKSTGGTLKRGLFLTQLEAFKDSTLSFNIITPEYVYMNYQIIGINHSRSAQDGATLIKVNLDLQEVIETKLSYANEEVTNPSDASTVDGGAKQAEEKPTSILQDIFG